MEFITEQGCGKCVHYQFVLTDILPRNKNVYWPKEKFICSMPNLQDIAYLCMVGTAPVPNTGSPLESRIMQDFEKYYYQNLTIICRAKAWVVDGCVNRDGIYVMQNTLTLT